MMCWCVFLLLCLSWGKLRCQSVCARLAWGGCGVSANLTTQSVMQHQATSLCPSPLPWVKCICLCVCALVVFAICRKEQSCLSKRVRHQSPLKSPSHLHHHVILHLCGSFHYCFPNFVFFLLSNNFLFFAFSVLVVVHSQTPDTCHFVRRLFTFYSLWTY